MSIRSILATVLLLTAAAKLGHAAENPNIVLIISDDQKWTDYSFMGHPTIRTPNIDRLSEEGLLFTRGYVPTSLCRPSLASIITGLYPHQHRITGNDPAVSPPDRNNPDYLKLNADLIRNIERVDTLPRLLARQGYLSFQNGKWWEGHYSRGGFTHGMTHGDPARGGRHGDEGLTIGRKGLEPIRRFIDEAGDKPFFIWYAPFLPHTPHNPPDRLLNRYRTADRPVELSRYYAMCQWFDETVGELLQLIDQRGLSRRTLVVYVTDNGWIQRTPVLTVPSGWSFQFAPASKRSPNEAGIRTPIIVRWAGKVAPGRIEHPVSSLDIAPTILNAAGLTAPETMTGKNLLEESEIRSRRSVFGCVFAHDIADILDPAASLKHCWIVEGPWKLIVPHSPVVLDARVQLYQVVEDPDETRNLAHEQAARVRQMERDLNQWWNVE